MRLLGGGVTLAYGAQTLVTLCVLASLAWLWRTCREPAICGAALLTATLLTTPYALDYDEVVLGPAFALMVAHGLKAGFAPFEKTVLALTWAMPLFARTLGGLGLPLGPLATLLLYGVIVARGAAKQQHRPASGVYHALIIRSLRETFMPQLAFPACRRVFFAKSVG